MLTFEKLEARGYFMENRLTRIKCNIFFNVSRLNLCNLLISDFQYLHIVVYRDTTEILKSTLIDRQQK